MAQMTWSAFIMKTLVERFGPARRIELTSIYQALRHSDDLQQMNDIESFEDTARGTLNSLVKAGKLERVERGVYRLPS